MGLSFSHLLLLLVLVLILFGAGKLPQVMGDLAKGFKAFKDGMNDKKAEDSSEESKPKSNRASKIIDGEIVPPKSKSKNKNS